jgi:hypothetical protein
MAPEQFSVVSRIVAFDYYGVASVAFEAAVRTGGLSRQQTCSTSSGNTRHFVLPAREDIGEGISEEMYDVLLRGLEHDPDRRSLDFEKTRDCGAAPASAGLKDF